MGDWFLLFAFDDSPNSRLAVFAVSLIGGIIFILAGINNVRTERAEESGKRRLVNMALGSSNSYEGTKAVLIGWMRIVCGVGCICFGIFFLCYGPILAR